MSIKEIIILKWNLSFIKVDLDCFLLPSCLFGYLQQKVAFWFATGGAGFCISKALGIAMVPEAGYEYHRHFFSLTFSLGKTMHYVCFFFFYRI